MSRPFFHNPVRQIPAAIAIFFWIIATIIGASAPKLADQRFNFANPMEWVNLIWQLSAIFGMIHMLLDGKLHWVPWIPTILFAIIFIYAINSDACGNCLTQLKINIILIQVVCMVLPNVIDIFTKKN